MKRLAVMTGLLLALFFLPGCARRNMYSYTYTGESEHWKAEYLYQGIEVWGEEDGRISYSNSCNYRGSIKYKGSPDEIEDLKKLEFSFKAGLKSSSAEMNFDDGPGKSRFAVYGSSEGSAQLEEYEVIYVTVKWDGAEESFELYKKKGIQT